MSRLMNIEEVAMNMGLFSCEYDKYGDYKAKFKEETITNIINKRRNDKGKLILVTATNPTKYGEGKTTVSIGLSQALNELGKSSIVALREPSLAPCFGVKGGATGGGKSQILPMDEINLHFTGDIHAVGSAQNLLCAMLDNHIHQGNELNVDIHNINIKRAIDISDRMLRNITIGLGGRLNGTPREDGFELTVACELMAILCLAEDLSDLERRINNMTIAFNKDGDIITPKDIKATGSIMALLKDAFRPNFVQTTEGTPAFVHGSPFANIAHGCNSVRATKLAMNLCEYTVTEAGFGSDLGAEKFMNIKCRQSGIEPDVAVIVTTIRALKEQGTMDKGLDNLERHIMNMMGFNIPVIVTLNKFGDDTEKEIQQVKDLCCDMGTSISVCECWEHGGNGAIDLAEKVILAIQNKKENIKLTYDDKDNVFEKLVKISKKIYGADKVILEDSVRDKLLDYISKGYDNLPICMAKTPMSFSDNPKLVGSPTGFDIHIRDVKLCSGAGFIVAYTGKVMTLPALPKVPSAENVKVENGEIKGLF